MKKPDARLLKALRRVKGVLFDVDETLYSSTDQTKIAWTKAKYEYLTDMGVKYLPDFEEFRKAASKSYKATGKASIIIMEKLGTPAAEQKGKGREIHIEVCNRVATELTNNPDLIVINPHIRTLFNRLRMPVIAVTHGSGRLPHTVLKTLGIDHKFHDRVIRIEDVAYETKDKSPTMAIKGARRIGIAFENCAFIEDTSRNLNKPKKLGMASILIARKLPRGGHRRHIDHRVTDVEDVLRALLYIERIRTCRPRTSQRI